ALTAFLDPLREASALLMVWNGSDLLLLARGSFRQPPSGYTMIGDSTAAAGAPDRIRAAQAQFRAGESGVPNLVKLIPAAAIWAVVERDGKLPLTGNLSNLNNLFGEADYTTAAAQMSDPVNLSATALCPTPENARRLEQSVRALATLAAAAN